MFFTRMLDFNLHLFFINLHIYAPIWLVILVIILIIVGVQYYKKKYRKYDFEKSSIFLFYERM